MQQLEPMVRCVISTVDQGTLTRPMNWIRLQQGVAVHIKSDEADAAAEAELYAPAQVHARTVAADPLDDQAMAVIKELADYLRQSAGNQPE